MKVNQSIKFIFSKVFHVNTINTNVFNLSNTNNEKRREYRSKTYASIPPATKRKKERK